MMPAELGYVSTGHHIPRIACERDFCEYLALSELCPVSFIATWVVLFRIRGHTTTIRASISMFQLREYALKRCVRYRSALTQVRFGVLEEAKVINTKLSCSSNLRGSRSLTDPLRDKSQRQCSQLYFSSLVSLNRGVWNLAAAQIFRRFDG